MATDATISNPQVASGATIELGAVEVEYGWSGLMNTNPIPGKFDLAFVDVGGWENPIITVRGVIDVDLLQNQSTNSQTGNTLLTPAHVYQFARVQFDNTTNTVSTLIVTTGGTTDDASNPGTPVSSTILPGSDGTTQNIKCVLRDFTITLNASSSKESTVWNYSLTFIETLTG